MTIVFITPAFTQGSAEGVPWPGIDAFFGLNPEIPVEKQGFGGNFPWF
jgi:hypothetical protein